MSGRHCRGPCPPASAGTRSPRWIVRPPRSRTARPFRLGFGLDGERLRIVALQFANDDRVAIGTQRRHLSTDRTRQSLPRTGLPAARTRSAGRLWPAPCRPSGPTPLRRNPATARRPSDWPSPPEIQCCGRVRSPNSKPARGARPTCRPASLISSSPKKFARLSPSPT